MPFELLNDLLNVAEVLISPSTLMISQTPERRYMAGSNIRMVLLNHLLWILLPTYYDKMNVTANRIID